MRIVVKLGSSLVASSKGAVRRSLLAARATEVAALAAGGHSVCIVSSGAIALGAPRLGFARRPSTMRQLQAASAVGQAQLQQAWERAFSRVGLQAAQILLSPADVADRQTYVNVCNTFDALFRLGAVPVVNENDATATDEITFGDNDALAAQVAVLTHARLLVLLTEVDGVYSRAPGTPGAELLDDGSLTSSVRLGRGTGLGRGGMGSKIAAAELAAGAGIPTVIASGQAANVLVPIVAGERRGTRFEGGAAPSEPAFKLWIRYGKQPRGTVVLDAGAERALRGAGASVLAVGVTACDGGFGAGDAIELVSATGVPIGKGIASIAAAEVGSESAGSRSSTGIGSSSTRFRAMGLAHWDDVEPHRRAKGEMDATWKRLGEAAGTKGVGVNLVRVAPGKLPTPPHSHGASEEVYFVLGGSGLAWQDDQVHEVRPGDCVIHRANELEHTFIAGPDGLEYLVFGTRHSTDFGWLPRSGAVRLGWPWVEGRVDDPWDREAEAPPLAYGEPAARPPNILNIDEVELEHLGRSATAPLATRERSDQAGFHWERLEPGARGSVPHCHSEEEEVFVILEGEGMLHLWPSPSFAPGAEQEEIPIRAGHVVARPPATRVSHWFRAGETGLTMLIYGTRRPNDMCWYPRSNKIAWRGLGVIGRIEVLEYDDGEPDD